MMIQRSVTWILLTHCWFAQPTIAFSVKRKGILNKNVNKSGVRASTSLHAGDVTGGLNPDSSNMLRLQVYRNPKDDRICTVIGSEAKEAIEKAGWKPVAVSFASTAAQVQSLIDAPDAANGGQAVAIENPDLDEELLNALMNTSETDEERKQKLNDLVIRGASIERSLSMIRAASDTNNGAKNMKALLDLGGSVQDCDKYGSTPLHIAAFFCNAEVAEILLENGADIEAKDNDGETPTLVLEKTIQRNLDMELGFGTEMPPEERQRQDKIKELFDAAASN